VLLCYLPILHRLLPIAAGRVHTHRNFSWRNDRPLDKGRRSQRRRFSTPCRSCTTLSRNGRGLQTAFCPVLLPLVDGALPNPSWSGNSFCQPHEPRETRMHAFCRGNHREADSWCTPDRREPTRFPMSSRPAGLVRVAEASGAWARRQSSLQMCNLVSVQKQRGGKRWTNDTW